MWNFASKCLAGTGGLRLRNSFRKLKKNNTPVHSDDDVSSAEQREDGLECPICWESFNIVENVPYVLWCGHSLCKNCILGLQWAVVKFPPLPIQLPLLISCPWCSLLSPRLIYKGILKFPRKNFFLLWMVEKMNGDGLKLRTHSHSCGDCQPVWPSKAISGSQARHSHIHRGQSSLGSSTSSLNQVISYHTLEMLHSYLRKSLLFFVELTAKFPLVLILLLIVLYAIPASAAILVLYILITILFAVPSFLILYFAYPSLDWLVKEIVA